MIPKRIIAGITQWVESADKRLAMLEKVLAEGEPNPIAPSGRKMIVEIIGQVRQEDLKRALSDLTYASDLAD